MHAFYEWAFGPNPAEYQITGLNIMIAFLLIMMAASLFFAWVANLHIEEEKARREANVGKDVEITVSLPNQLVVDATEADLLSKEGLAMLLSRELASRKLKNEMLGEQ